MERLDSGEVLVRDVEDLPYRAASRARRRAAPPRSPTSAARPPSTTAGKVHAVDVAKLVMFVLTRPPNDPILEVALRPVTETSGAS